MKVHVHPYTKVICALRYVMYTVMYSELMLIHHFLVHVHQFLSAVLEDFGLYRIHGPIVAVSQGVSQVMYC